MIEQNKNQQLEDILTVMTSFKQTVNQVPQLPIYSDIILRHKLAKEELNETAEALKDIYTSDYSGINSEDEYNDIMITKYSEVIDGIIDQLVILAGTFNTYGYTTGYIKTHIIWNNFINTHFTNKTFKGFWQEEGVNFDFKLIDSKLSDIDVLIDELKDVSIRNWITYELDSNINIKRYITNLSLTLNNILELSSLCGFNDKKLFDIIWADVQRANMSKLDENGQPIFNEIGKFQKSKLYKRPEINDLLKKYINDTEFGNTLI